MSRDLLVSCEQIEKRYGVQPLFQGLSLTLSEGDRVGVVGPNGSGKTTLMKILAGLETPDAGTRSARKTLRLGYVPQEPALPSEGSVEDALRAVLLPAEREQVEAMGRVAATLGRAGFTDFHQAVSGLSAGWRKRLAIARELVQSPDLVLFDEPTNDLDLDGIMWLEALLTTEVPAYCVVSHDRYLLEAVATRVLEVNRAYPQGLFEGEGSYSAFLLKREEFFEQESAYRDSLANKVRREVEWLRRGAKARTRKSSARIKAAGEMIEELATAEQRARTATAGIEFTASGRVSRKLLVGRGLMKAQGGRTLFEGLDFTLSPGIRLGLVGPSGSGKSTLLKILAGQLTADRGSIERAAALQTVAFAQDRAGLDPDVSLRRTLAPEGDAVIYQGRSVHVASWAKRFLFRSEQLETAVGRLSGGERARLLIARLMLQPADLLLLDEPTNDLDIPTLEVLEETLAEFAGALVLVTRDRFLLDRVATRILALEGDGRASMFADYAQWQAARAVTDRTSEVPSTPRQRAPDLSSAVGRKRLTYLEQREWDGIEGTILEAEARVESCRAAVEDPAIASDPSALKERWHALEAARSEVDRLYLRWAELEEKGRPE
jgi:ABC transport system ATP-binding/permease protein